MYRGTRFFWSMGVAENWYLSDLQSLASTACHHRFIAQNGVDMGVAVGQENSIGEICAKRGRDMVVAPGLARYLVQSRSTRFRNLCKRGQCELLIYTLYY